MARSARCDVRRGAAVFVGSDETTVSQNRLCFDAFRRLLLQIGGANIAGADRALERAYFVVVRRRKACLLAPPQHGAWRDPVFDCSARFARSARIAPWSAPTSSSFGDEKRVCSLLLSTARGAIRFDCSARWLGEGQSLGGYWSTGAEDSITSTACLLVYGGA
jgi:hypothetical protein